MLIRPALVSDRRAVWSIIGPTIRAGDTYALDPAMTEADALDYWFGADRETFVAVEAGAICGTYYIRRNQAGGGAHVCNCGYMTGGTATGRGIARAMGAHSLAHAKAQGFTAIQFNFVVASNERAIHLWHALGFETVGRLPGAFRHPTLGLVDALVMFQTL